MPTSAPLDTLPAPADGGRFQRGWPLLLAVATWAIALAVLPGLDNTPAATTPALLVLATTALGSGAFVLFRIPVDRVTLPFMALTGAAATLLALAALDRPLNSAVVAAMVLVTPWRYALPPLLVHVALEVSWGNARSRWIGWVIGWYAVAAVMLLAAGVGRALNEAPLIEAIDLIFRGTVEEPAAALFALIACALAALHPGQGRNGRRASVWMMAAIALGWVPLLLAEFVPGVAPAGASAARLSLWLLPAGTAAAVLTLPFRDAAARDLAAHVLAQGLLDSADMPAALQRIAAWVQRALDARSIRVRLVDPDLDVSLGENTEHSADTPAIPLRGHEPVQQLVVPIGRAGDPLGEVFLASRLASGFGRIEREWLDAFLRPLAQVLRARRREIVAGQQLFQLAHRLTEQARGIAAAAGGLPLPPTDSGLAVPPPVDAREVLTQLSDGVDTVGRHGEALGSCATDTREHARGVTDAIARAADALAALSDDILRMSRQGEDISSSNDTVAEIVFRINLVANNAALEATRAGNAGRTFGVLAEEVRRLADTMAATSVTIGQRTTTLGSEISAAARRVEAARTALLTAVREAEAGEIASQRLSTAAIELEDAARSLGPSVTEANAVARRRSSRDHHLTTTLERFLTERAEFGRALTRHRDAMERAAEQLAALTDEAPS
jgi:hypothetical protein